MPSSRPFCLLAFTFIVASSVPAQPPGAAPPTVPSAAARQTETILFAGLIQPLLLRGVNVALTHLGQRFAISYSHGMFLHYDAVDFLRSKEERNQSLDVYSPWSTGAGVGWRLGRSHDMRLELKAHRYHVTSPTGEQVRYTTWSVGPGFYRRRQARGSRLVIEPSVRFWPNVGSSLAKGEHVFTADDGTRLRHRPHQLGVIANLSVGWSF